MAESDQAETVPADESAPPRPRLLNRARAASSAIVEVYSLLLPFSRVALLLACISFFIWVTGCLPLHRAGDVTMSISAQTETFRFRIGQSEQIVWKLPGGRFSIVAPDNGETPDCPNVEVGENAEFFHTCEFERDVFISMQNLLDVNAVIRPEQDLIESGHYSKYYELREGGPSGNSSSLPPAMRLEVLPLTNPSSADNIGSDEYFCTDLPANDDLPAPRIELRDEFGNLIHATGERFVFDALPVTGWKTALDLRNIEIGVLLTSDTSWQPILTNGEVRMFAKNNLFSGGPERRYLVASETLDPADVLNVPLTRCWTGSRLMGLVSLGKRQDTLVEDGVFDLTLHADINEGLVRRIGARHEIGVTTWDIISRLPVLIAVWAVFVGVVLILSFAKGDGQTGRIARRVADLTADDDEQK